MSDSLYGIPSAALGPWADALQPASWRSVPFAVKSARIMRGRKTAVHDYPYRDVVWVEDLGRGRRRIAFTGFLVGDDVYDQQAAMLAAIEGPGPGNLVHPSLGTLTASLIESSVGDRADLGRVVELEFSFVEGEPQASFPTTDASTQDRVTDAAGACDDACGQDFVVDAGSSFDIGQDPVTGGVATVAGAVATVIGTANAVALVASQALDAGGAIVASVMGGVGQVVGLLYDAAIGASVALGLAGNYGRYAYGGLTAPLPATATVASQISALATSRAAVTASADVVLSTAQADPAALPAAIQAFMAAFLATVPDPGDQLRLLATLAAYGPPIMDSGAPIGAAVATVQTAVAALLRRAACAALGRAAAAYQPSSYNDAVSQIDTLTDLLEAEALVAADAGDDGSYDALRSLLTAITADLITRGAGLPDLITVTRARSLPSLVLAYQIYGDATRADELVARADPVNALFMPTAFEALSA